MKNIGSSINQDAGIVYNPTKHFISIVLSWPWSFSILLGSLLGPFLIDNSFLSISKLSSLLSAEGKSIMSLVPLSEWSGINDDNSVLDEGLGSDQLIVASIVYNINNPSFARHCLRTPREITSIEPECSVLLVSA